AASAGMPFVAYKSFLDGAERMESHRHLLQYVLNGERSDSAVSAGT
ncbi:MAG: hypothetical protein GWN87_25210, partial [Desulfuromonadales bacterium]|nr:hypothetical protein [Desulfuromonadales bacterium]NIS43105.1 hypothetical protein [Desulfuromonadales bacterium]